MFIERLQVEGLLSFGPKGIDLPLEPLNVLIGTNGSGKSNLLYVLRLLRDAAGGDKAALDGRDWKNLLWQGPPQMAEDAPAKATVVADVKLPEWEESLRYSLKLWPSGASGATLRESIGLIDESGDTIALPDDRSALQRLHRKFGDIRLYNNWVYGEISAIRKGQGPSDLPYSDGPRLLETAGNLPGLISRFSRDRKDRLTKHLRVLYEGVEDIHTPFDENKVSVVIEESGGRQIPAERISDGTLRYLSLLTALLDPDPPPLIAIEEPELGLHPDIVFEFTKLLIEASERTQLVVTTHSHTLVDELTDHPTSVVACEKYQGQTRFKRVTPGLAEVWLNDQTLGEVWSMGGLGGNRW